MQLGALLTRLSDENDAAVALDALGDVVLLAQIQEMGEQHDETPGEYVANASRRYAAQAGDEDWLALMTAIERADDPARVVLGKMLRWALASDAAPAPATSGGCSCGSGGAMTIDEAAAAGGEGAGKTFADPIPAALLDTPLEYILVDHVRQRSLCAAFRRFTLQGYIDRAEADAVVAYLRRDVDLHHRDEEEDLFPSLLRRAPLEDDLGTTLARLVADHRQLRTMIEAIIKVLTKRAGPGPVRLGPAARKLLLAYAASEHHHLAAENGIVLAIARVRLTRGDLSAMSATMKDRHGAAA